MTIILFCSLLAAAPSGLAFGNHSGFIQQPAQQPSAEAKGPDDGQEVRTLEPGKPIRRELAGGQQHTYQIRLNSYQFLKVIVEQDGIDVVVQVSEPDGKQLAEFDSESRLKGPEPVALVTEASGNYRTTDSSNGESIRDSGSSASGRRGGRSRGMRP